MDNKIALLIGMALVISGGAWFVSLQQSHSNTFGTFANNYHDQYSNRPTNSSDMQSIRDFVNNSQNHSRDYNTEYGTPMNVSQSANSPISDAIKTIPLLGWFVDKPVFSFVFGAFDYVYVLLSSLWDALMSLITAIGKLPTIFPSWMQPFFWFIPIVMLYLIWLIIKDSGLLELLGLLKYV